MLFCVDGSGPAEREVYAREMRNSFVNDIFHHSTQAVSRYFRGPDLLGDQLLSPRYLGQRIRALRSSATGDERRIYLAGYSRGAAVCVATARDLNLDNIPVAAMFLFDTVDRSGTLDGIEVIAANVEHVYHAVRDGRARSRLSFGTAGRSAVREGAYEQAVFMTSHGGMGGAPWGVAGLMPREALEYSLAPPSRQRYIREHALINEGFDEGMGAGLFGALDSFSAPFMGRDYGSMAGETSLTVAAEAHGMQEVRRWMWPHLRHHGVVTN